MKTFIGILLISLLASLGHAGETNKWPSLKATSLASSNTYSCVILESDSTNIVPRAQWSEFEKNILKLHNPLDDSSASMQPGYTISLKVVDAVMKQWKVLSVTNRVITLKRTTPQKDVEQKN